MWAAIVEVDGILPAAFVLTANTSVLESSATARALLLALAAATLLPRRSVR